MEHAFAHAHDQEFTEDKDERHTLLSILAGGLGRLHERENAGKIIERIISSIGYGEQRLIALTLLAKANSPLTAGAIRRAAIEAQGEQVSWEPSHRLFFNYCQNVFEPQGLLVRSTVLNRRHEEVEAYKISELGSTTGLGIAGHLMKWSLDHPDLALTTFMGGRYSVNEEGVSGQWARVGIFADLLSTPNDEQSVGGLKGFGDVGIEQMSRILGELEDDGLINIEHAADLSSRIFETKASHGRDSLRPLETASSVAQAYHKVLGELISEEGTISADDIVTRMVDILPRTDIREIRSFTARTFTTSYQALSPSSGLIGKNFNNDGSLSRVSLEPAMVKALQGLLDIIFNSSNPAYIAEGRKLAEKIISDATQVSELMRKAKEHSSMTDTLSKQEMHDLVVASLDEGAQYTVDDIRQLLSRATGKNYTRNGVDNIIRRMANNGLLSSGDFPQANTARLIRKYYLPSSDSPNVNLV